MRKTDARDPECTYENLFSKIEAIKDLTLLKKCYSEDILEFIEYIEKEDAYHSAAVKHKLALMFLDIANSIEAKSSTASTEEKEMDNSFYRAMIIERYIDVSFNSPNASLGEVAGVMCLSTKQTSRIVKQITGLSFKQLLLKQRMHLAKELIESEDLKMYEIAYAVGYNSYESFYKAFSKYFGYASTKAE